MKSKIITYFIIAFCIISFVLSYIQREKAYEIISLADEQKIRIDDLKFKYSNLKDDFIQCLKDNGSYLNPNIEILDLKGNPHYLKNKITEKTFVVRFSQMNCQACIDAILPIIQDFFPPQNKNILFLVDFANHRFIETKKHLYNLSEYQILKVDSLRLGMEELNIPYFFTLNKNLYIEDAFIPHKEELKHVKEYLKTIRNKIIKKNESSY